MKCRNINCFIVGSGNLAVYCSQQLLKNGIQISGAVSFDNIFDSFLQKQSIKNHSYESLHDILKRNKVDYLLSITNPALLNKTILKLPKIAAINYHDSLLSKYAGAYSTSWAILNNELEHGVTWHHMESKFDAGNVILQGKITIDRNDTASSLNAKCFEKAKKTFRQLIKYFYQDKLPSKKQDLDKRIENYFSSSPPNYGFINWQDTVDSIDKLCRSLDFGAYDNSFGTAKIQVENTYYNVKEWETRKQINRERPGTVYETTPHLTIIASDGLFIIKNASNTQEEILTGEEIAIRHQLSSLNTLLPAMDHEKTQFIQKKHASIINNINQTKDETIFLNNRLEELFTKQARLNPNKIALIDNETEINYQKLDNISSSVASSIRQESTQKTQLVGIYLEKSWQQVASALGILKAGYSYLPLSIDDPIKRIELVIKKAKLTTIITNQFYAEKLSTLSDLTILNFDNISNSKITPLPSPNEKYQDDAYVIFTSGTTGTPKGVVVSHMSAVNTILDINKKFNITSNDIVFGISRLNFDLSVYDIFGTFAAGATLVIAREEDLKDPIRWATLIKKHKITIWNSVPALLNLLADFAKTLTENFSSTLRLALLSGDWIPLSLFNKVEKNLHNEITLISLGGATECSIWSNYYPIKKINPNWKSIPYGTPLANQQLFVLDKLLRKAPIGVTGEIFIGGIGVAKGYLNDPELTRKSFIYHPTLGRIYRTGDLGRLNDDGNYEILGRIDSQVKIHGMRIETAEIEYWLIQHGYIDQAKVISIQQNNIHHLIAFIQPIKPIAQNQLNDYLSKHVPQYMIPSQYIELNDWPLTKNGKIDYSILASIFKKKSICKNSETVTAATTSIARQFQYIWKKVLSLNFLPALKDNFFHLGGDSILSLILTQELKNIGYDFRNEMIFRYPTIDELIRHLKPNEYSSTNIETNAETLYQPTLSQQGLLSDSLLELTSDVYLEQVSWETNGQLDIKKYHSAWKKLFSTTDALRTILVKKDDIIHIKFIELAKLAWTYHGLADTDRKSNFLLDDFVLNDRNNIFNLFDNLLFRVSVIEISQKKYITLLTFHHIILDGLSISLLIKKLYKIYKELVTEINSEPERINYFSTYLNRMNEITKKTSSTFWNNYIDKIDKVSYLPIYKPGMTYDKTRVIKDLSIEQIDLPEKLIRSLAENAKNYNSTISSLHQSAWSFLLAYYLNQREVTNGLVLSGRNTSVDTTETIGFFINTAPFNIDAEPYIKFSEFVKKSHEIITQLDSEDNPGLVNIQDKISLKQALFDHILVFNQDIDVDIDTPHLTIGNIIYNEKTNYPLTITFTLGKKSYIKFSYDNSLIDSSKILNLKNHYINILNYISKNKDCRLSDINILNKSEWSSLVKFTNSKIKTKEINIFDLIYQTAEKHTNRTAIILGNNDEISYKNLISETNVLAYSLKNESNPVIIFLPRTQHLISAILACLQVGRPYITLSADTPIKRLENIAKEAGCKDILTERFISKEITTANINKLFIDELLSIKNKLRVSIYTNNPVYIIFTSGTTGSPKAVAINQNSLLNCLESFTEILNIDKTDKLLSTTQFSFDIAQLEILLPLLSGASIIFCDDTQINDPQKLKNMNKIQKPTIFQTTPSKWQLLLDGGWNGEYITKYISGGDTLSLTLARKLLSFNPLYFYNVYGPTETTIWSTFSDIKAIKSAIPIGKPINNTTCLVLNYFLKPLPENMIGELYIGGHGLADGYLNTNNADKFTYLSEFNNMRFYKTGDLVYKQNDALFFVARNDRQIKIRGYRIDPDEITEAMKHNSDIKDAAIISHNQEIVAFCVPNQLPPKKMKASLFYFSHAHSNYKKGYEFILKSSQIADKLGFEAIWIPERHFDPIGALFPNPALLAANIASSTTQIKLRAGSVVLPLNDSLRIAEDWAMVDNLSQGRAGVSFATGWHPNDFVLAPEKFSSRKVIFADKIHEILNLWAGKSINRQNGLNISTNVNIYPLPIQSFIPIWITAAGSAETFELAGKLGANLLTHLLIQDLNELKNKLSIYRNALRSSGFDPESKCVTIMIHTFIHNDHDKAISIAYEPFKNYLRQHVSLLEKMTVNNNLSNNEADIESHIESATKTFIKNNSLIGSAEECAKTIEYLSSIGVDELACLIDFGIDEENVINSIPLITRLMAHYESTAHSYAKINETVISDELAKYLPSYMLPSRYHFINKIPLSNHGKIDTCKLKNNLLENKNIKNIDNQTDNSEIDTIIENQLYHIWKDILEKNDISYFDSFFAIGGHSLKAIQVINKIESKFGIILTIRDFFQNQTITKLANLIKRSERLEDLTKEVAIDTYDEHLFPLSFGQQSLWYMHQIAPDSARYNDSFAIKFSNPIDFNKLSQAIEKLHQVHPILRSSIIESNGKLLHKINDSVTKLQLINIQDKNLNSLIRVYANQPFYLEKNLSRFILFENKNTHILLISIHHIITDGRSLEILLKDLTLLYDTKEPIVSNYGYKKYIWLDTNIYQNNHEKWFEKWKIKFDHFNVITYKNAYTRPKLQNYKGAVKKLILHESKIKSIALKTNDFQCSLYVFFLSVFSISLKLISNDSSFSIGMPYANRDSNEYNNAIGCFVNILSTSIKINENETIKQHTENVLENVLHAFNYRSLPFNKLVEMAKIERNMSYHPLCQIIFGMYDMREFPKDIASIPYEIMDIDFGISRYDLEVQALQKPDCIEFLFRYNTDIFSDNTIENFIKGFSKSIDCILSKSNPIISVIFQNIANQPIDSNGIKAIIESKFPIKVDKIETQHNDILLYYSTHNENNNSNSVIESWKHIYNKTYSINNVTKYVGWISSYTNQPYSTAEMDEWINETATRIKLLNQDTILEIGSGSGLLIEKLLPTCKHYVATDFSISAIENLKINYSSSKLNIHCCPAEKVHSFVKNKKFNLIILNSVIQYFPNIEYFIHVITESINLIDEGYIFIGDIKNSDILAEFYEDLCTIKFPQYTGKEVKNYIYDAIESDIELSIPPKLLLSLKHISNKITNVTINIKKGSRNTEMNKFRYDCIISINKSIEDKKIETLEWNSSLQNSSLANIFKIKNIRNNLLNSTKNEDLNVFLDALTSNQYFYDFIYNVKNPYNFDLIATKNSPSDIYALTHHDELPLHATPFTYCIESLLNNLLFKVKYNICIFKNENEKLINLPNNIVKNEFHAKEIFIKIWKDLLNTNDITTNSTFFELGGNSITSIQMIARARQEGLDLIPQEFLDNQTIDSLIQLLSSKEETHKNSAILNNNRFSLSPIQQWLINQNLYNIHHWNQAFLLELKQAVSKEFLQHIFNNLLKCYDNSNIRITPDFNNQYILSNFNFNIDYYDFSKENLLSDDPVSLLKDKIKSLQGSLNIYSGPLFKIALFDLGKLGQRLLIIFHNLIMDGVSWRIFLDDLAFMWSGREILIQNSNTYEDWVLALKSHANSCEASKAKEFWLSKKFNNQSLLNTSAKHYLNTYKYQEIVKLSLSKKSLLARCPNFSSHIALLSAFLLAINQVLEIDSIYVDIESHGRFDYGSRLDLSRTLGWFTAIFPTLFEVNNKTTLESLFHYVNEIMQDLSEHGPSYMPLKAYSTCEQTRENLNSHPAADIAFNYFGEFEQSFLNHPYFKLAQEEMHSYYDENNVRPHLLHFNAIDFGKEISIEIRYCSTMFNIKTMNKVKKIIEHFF